MGLGFKIKCKLSNIAETIKDAVKTPLGWVIIGGSAFFLSACGHCVALDINQHNAREVLVESEVMRSEYSKNIGDKAGVSWFEAASVEVLQQENDNYFLRTFGYTTSDVDGKILKNISVSIRDEDALKIIEAVRQKSVTFFGENFANEGIYKVADFSTFMPKTFQTFKNAQEVKKHKDTIEVIFEALNNAVKNCCNATVQEVGEIESIKTQTYTEVIKIIKPSSPVTNIYPTKEFIKEGLIITDISTVYSDDDKNASFFYIDTIQTGFRDKYLVEVEGSDLSVEDVYAKFITGQQKSFKKIGRTSLPKDLQAETEVNFFLR